MAELFIVFAVAMLAILLRQRQLAIATIAIGLFLVLGMFLHHATDTLQINW
jgi:hypothetical protein